MTNQSVSLKFIFTIREILLTLRTVSLYYALRYALRIDIKSSPTQGIFRRYFGTAYPFTPPVPSPFSYSLPPPFLLLFPSLPLELDPHTSS